MKWQGRTRSDNVEDRRGSGGRSSGGGFNFGRGMRPGRLGTGVGVVGVIIAVVYSLVTGQDPTRALRGIGNGSSANRTTNSRDAYDNPRVQDNINRKREKTDEMAEFVSVVLKDCEDVWNKLFQEKYREDYREPVLVLYSGGDESACGTADAAMGPFYCPGDEKVYIDLDFFKELKTKYDAPGDFAVAYVVAHEVGHHVQNLLGTSSEVHAKRAKLSEAEYNKLSVRLELQADFYAGIWAHHAQKMKSILDPGDIDEALGAASAVGDDKLQKKSRGYAMPESFTHGSSAQRMKWFRKGFDTGDIDKGDTFSARDL
jgi:predicted metalloprotease